MSKGPRGIEKYKKWFVWHCAAPGSCLARLGSYGRYSGAQK
jgi:hypothetical protein